MPHIVVHEQFCKSCGLCREACPQKILDFSSSLSLQGHYPIRCVEPEKCTGCAMCARTCPDVVIDVYR